MIYRTNLTLEEMLDLFDLKDHESFSQLGSIPEEAYEISESAEALPSFTNYK